MSIEHGHNLGTEVAETCAASGQQRRAPDRVSVAPGGWPRLMSLDLAASYLGLSRWTLEQFIAAGELAVIHPPRPNTAKAMRPRPSKGQKPSRPVGDQLRRVLVDREDLERIADEWRSR